MMEHEEVYMLMMDALDDELAAGQKFELEAHLRACPPCMLEWQALLAIDRLFRQSPALSPAAGFTQRTLARLPDRHYRIWLISVIYVLLLLGGALPMLLGLWIVSRVVPLLRDPAVGRSLLQALEHTWQVAGAVAGALMSGLNELVVQEPAVLGWLLVLAGIVFLWSGVYRQLLTQPRQIQ